VTQADLIVRGGHLVLADEVRRADLVVDGGTIRAIVDADDTTYGADEQIDARGMHVLPGLVDGHVHLNEPGHAEREGYLHGTRAAAAGGITTLIDMPLSCTPTTNDPAALALKRAVAAPQALVDYGHWAGLVSDNLAAMEGLHGAGVLGFKAFMSDTGMDDFPRATDGVLYAGLREAARLGSVVLVHAENEEIARIFTTPLLAAGRRDPLAWAEGRPPLVEEEATRCALSLAGAAGARIHIVHATTSRAVAAVRDACAHGVRATCETCPQYLTLCDEDLARIGVEAKCGPPLRSRATREALWERVLAGEVDSIASDHAPCVAGDKADFDDDVWAAAGGIAGMQTMLPLLLSEGVFRRGMPLPLLARLMSSNPARQFGLAQRKGRLAPGADADLVLVDLEGRRLVTPESLFCRNPHSPFVGMELRGCVEMTLVRGTVVYDRGFFPAPAGHGQLLLRGDVSSVSV
jgi:allantoinase